MRVLVTGATGFVGRHLVLGLSHDHDVVAVARRDAPIEGASEVRLVPGIGADTDWTGILSDIDVVVHLAARVHVMRETAADPLDEFREVNTRGTERLAVACAEQGVRRLIFMSSIKVNGEGGRDEPYSAEDPAAPGDPYGISKWEAERALAAISAETGLETVILRPTVIYGVGVGGNIQRIIQLLRTRAPLPLRSVRNRRTMLSVGNLTKWVARAITIDEAPKNPILMGDPVPVSTYELASSLGTGMGIRTLFMPVPVRVMGFTARLLGQGALAQRLFQDLEVIPTFEAFPGLLENLEQPAAALDRLGRAIASDDAGGPIRPTERP